MIGDLELANGTLTSLVSWEWLKISDTGVLCSWKTPVIITLVEYSLNLDCRGYIPGIL